jgi:hypothetical protein
MAWRRPWKSDGVEVIGWREFAGLLDDSLMKQVGYASGLVGYGVRCLLRRTDGGAASVLPVPPPTDWARVARKVACETMDAHWVAHSERTWLFATALASRDMQRAVAKGKPFEKVDAEQLHVASLLHDTGLLVADRTKCFAVTGAANAWSTAEEAGVDDASVKVVAEAISSHISIKPGNQLGRYVQAGSLLDGIGDRVWHLDRAMMEKVCEKWPRTGFPAELRRRWTQECSLFPNGRAAFARCPGGITLATYLAPLPR